MHRYICVCDLYVIYLYYVCVLLNHLINTHVLYMHCVSPGSWRPLWSLQQSPWGLWCQQYRLLWVPNLCRHIWKLLAYFACLRGSSAWYLLSVIGGCVPSLQLLAETPCDPWSGPSCYCFISLMPSALSLWHHRCTVTCLSCSPQLQLLTLQNMCAHRGESPLTPGEFEMEFHGKTDCAEEVQDRTTQT